MGGLRRGARVVLIWFSALYVLAIIVAILLAGEGIFRLKNIVNSDDCSKRASKWPRPTASGTRTHSTRTGP